MPMTTCLTTLPLPNQALLFDLDALYKVLHHVKDQRKKRGLQYPLAEILLIGVLAKLAGQTSSRAIAHWAKLRSQELHQLFHLRKATMPYSSTWSRIFGNAVSEWLTGLDNRNKCSYNICMEIRTRPDALAKLAQIGDATQFEPAGDQPQQERLHRPVSTPDLAHCVTSLATPRGPKKVLKTMMTTACERNCFYCPFRAGRSKTRRVTFTPDEMAAGFEKLQHAGQVEGLFLSSGIIKGSVTTQDRIIATAELVRARYRYEGYLHLKIMPGIQKEQLYRVMQLAERVSVNLEAPTQERLAALAPKKEFLRELLGMLELAEQVRREHPGERLAQTVTQFVVGAVGDTDSELLGVSQHLYRALHVRRAYYSGFSPVEQTPFEQVRPTSELREHRLYQASFLLRDYGWSLDDLAFQDDGNLRQDLDPKRAWAETHLREAPVDLMTASRAQLLRIPGFGPHAADAILRARRQSRLHEIGQLRALRIAAPEQAAPYILLDGRRPSYQMRLF